MEATNPQPWTGVDVEEQCTGRQSHALGVLTGQKIGREPKVFAKAGNLSRSSLTRPLAVYINIPPVRLTAAATSERSDDAIGQLLIAKAHTPHTLTSCTVAIECYGSRESVINRKFIFS